MATENERIGTKVMIDETLQKAKSVYHENDIGQAEADIILKSLERQLREQFATGTS